MEKQHILLYYGVENHGADGIFHAFHAADPAYEHIPDDDVMRAKLAADLEIEPDSDNFYVKDMHIVLPETLIKRIQEQAIADYLKKGAAHFVEHHDHLAYQISRIIDARYAEEDIYGRIEQNPDINPGDIPEEDIPAIARRFEDIVGKNDGYFESYWLSADAAIEEYLKRKQGGACPVGRLDFLNSSAKVRESIDYYSESEFIADLTVELDYGVPLRVVLYQDTEGNTISRDFLEKLDCLPASVTVEPAPGVPTSQDTE